MSPLSLPSLKVKAVVPFKMTCRDEVLYFSYEITVFFIIDISVSIRLITLTTVNLIWTLSFSFLRPDCSFVFYQFYHQVNLHLHLHYTQLMFLTLVVLVPGPLPVSRLV